MHTIPYPVVSGTVQAIGCEFLARSDLVTLKLYHTILTIYAPMIYTAPCIMFWMRAYSLRGEVGGGWALEFPSFLGPVKWERADRRVPFGTQNLLENQRQLYGT
jgi:hypothetical protein